MNRKTLLSLLILDLLIIVMIAGFIYYRSTIITAAEQPPVPSTPLAEHKPLPPAAPAPVEQPDVVTPAPLQRNDVATPQRPATETTALPRKIAFSYRNSKVKMVQIIGDFNDWIPARMARRADHTWSVTLPIKPGEYAYNFVVDGRPIRDPNNPKICDAGRGFANSYLKVKPIDQE